MAATKKQTVEQMLLGKIEDLTQQIAELRAAQTTTAKVARKRERGQARPDVYYVLHAVPSQGVPPQAIACARILATAKNANHIPESEAMELIEAGKQSGRLKTNQDSWHIFQYYRPKLIGGNYLQMKTLEA